MTAIPRSGSTRVPSTSNNEDPSPYWQSASTNTHPSSLPQRLRRTSSSHSSTDSNSSNNTTRSRLPSYTTSALTPSAASPSSFSSQASRYPSAESTSTRTRATSTAASNSRPSTADKTSLPALASGATPSSVRARTLSSSTNSTSLLKSSKTRHPSSSPSSSAGRPPSASASPPSSRLPSSSSTAAQLSRSNSRSISAGNHTNSSTAPRLGDTLLRKSGTSARPVQTNPVTASANTRHGSSPNLPPSASMSSSLTTAKTNRAESRSPQGSQSLMGPPRTMGRNSSGSSRRSSLNGKGVEATGRQEDDSSHRVADASKSADGKAALPSLPAFDDSLHSTLLDLSPVRGQENSSHQQATARDTPTAATMTKPAPGSSRKPNFRLNLDQPSLQVNSRFSAFSSALPTPDAQSAHSGEVTPSYSQRSNGSSEAHFSASRRASNSSKGTPAHEMSHPFDIAGLGIGLPSGTSDHSRRQDHRHYPGTPDLRRPEASTSSSSPSPATASPLPSPSGYDRAGQIGIGELSTPRWNLPGADWGQSSRVMPRSSSGAVASSYGRSQPPESPTVSKNTGLTPSVPKSPVSISGARQREAEAKRHARAISLTANSHSAMPHRSPSGPAPTLSNSPSMPGHSLASLSSLTRDLGSARKEYLARAHKDATKDAAKRDSPDYSIVATSDSGSSAAHGVEEALLMANSITRKDQQKRSEDASLASPRRLTAPRTVEASPQVSSGPSPRIGDLAWSGEETGPFGVDFGSRSSASASPMPPSLDDSKTKGLSGVAGRSVNVDPFGISEAEYLGDSFDLNSAIADLLRDDEDRRRQRKDAGLDSDTEDPSARSSLDAAIAAAAAAGAGGDVSNRRLSSSKTPSTGSNARRGPTTAKVPSVPPSPASRLHDLGGEDGRANRSHARAARQSVGHTSANTSATSTPQQHRQTKRTSTASIAHSLLRGSMPFSNSETFDTEAAEALRKLDGIGSNSSARRSGSRERPSHDSGKSPRPSKSQSRPGSAGRRTPGSTSRPSSPNANNRTPRADNANRASRVADEQGQRARRTSRRLSKTRLPDEPASAGATGSPKISFDSPSVSSFSSPRVRKSVLPPLPTQALQNNLHSASYATQNSADSTTPPSTQTSRDSVSKDNVTSSSITSPLVGTPRLSISSKNKRASDASSHFSLGDMHASGTDDEEGTARLQLGSQVSGARQNPIIPPVPPLPKAWDTATQSSITSAATNDRGHNTSGIVASQSASLDSPVANFSPSLSTQMDDKIAASPRASQSSATSAIPGHTSNDRQSGSTSRPDSQNQSARRKWSLSNLSSAFGRTPATATTGKQNANNTQSAVQSPRWESTAPETSMSSFASKKSTDTNGLTSSSSGEVSGAGHSMSQTSDYSPSTRPPPSPSASTATAVPMGPSRRTPSFFRKRSEASVNSVADVSSPGQSFASSSAAPSEPQKTPPSGRASRTRSILGLGGLLKSSSSKKNLQQSSQSNEGETSSGTWATSSGSQQHDVQHNQQTPSSTPKSKLVGRRTSLIGRKRGKTLPSSADPPPVAPAQLPPMQVTPIADSPALASATKGKLSSSTNETSLSTDSAASGVPRRLANSSSAGDLSARASGSQKSSTIAGSQPAARGNAGAMPTIEDQSPSSNRVALSKEGVDMSDASFAQQGGVSEFGAPMSRIPRATGSIRGTPGRSAAPTASAALSADASGASGSQLLASKSISGSSSTRRLSSYGLSALPLMSKSSTMASLASDFGIKLGDEDSGSVASSDATVDASGQSTTATSRKVKGGLSTGGPILGANSPVSTSGHTTSGSAGHGQSQHSAVSSTVAPILSAYANAKTQSEIDGVLRRARIAAYSSNLSNSDRELLNNIISKHDPRKGVTSGDGAVKASGGMSASITVPSFAQPTAAQQKRAEDTQATPRSARTVQSATNSPQVGSKPPSATVASARRNRLSMVGSSSGARGARDAALSASAGRSSTRGTPTGLTPSLSDSRSDSAASTLLDEEERLGDEEMEAYIRRSHAKKLAAGVSQAELDKMVRFPEPEPPSKAYSPRQAEALWGNQLSDYEANEMVSYSEIYFVGTLRNKKHAYWSRPANNHGYDDERGDYQVVEGDHLAYRYEIMGTLGRGSFGQVLQCKDHKTGKSVAIKLIRNKKRFHHQALVEVKILENLLAWDPDEQFNVIKMTDSFYFRNHLCISMELLSINLYELIKANSFAGFSTVLIRRFCTQVLQSLSLMKHHRVVHCDLKPENILLKHPRKSAIKVIDFGSSCFEQEKVYTYIQSRFYRSPEVILGMNYHTAIDIWSLGCILAELYTGFPLFPGENEQEQLACIMEVLGVPDRYIVDRSSRKKLFFDASGAPRPVVNSKGKRRRPATKTLAQSLKCNDELFIDFLARCLVWDPERRIKPDPAMRHPWIRSAAGQKVLSTGLSSSGTGASGTTAGPSHARHASLSHHRTSGGGGSASYGSGVNGGTIGSGTARTARASMFGTGGTAGSTGGSVVRQASLRTGSNAGNVSAGATAGATGAGSTSVRRSQQQQQPVS